MISMGTRKDSELVSIFIFIQTNGPYIILISFFEFIYREFLKLIFTKSVSSSSMSILDKFCDLYLLSLDPTLMRSSESTLWTMAALYPALCAFKTFSSKLQSSLLINTMKAPDELSLSGGGTVGSQAFSGFELIKKPFKPSAGSL